MATKETPPFRAEHVGSLLRPAYLLEARRKFDKKEITREQLREFEDKAIADAVHMQRELGIKGFTDGEYRRHMFCDGFFEYLEGFEDVENTPVEHFKLYVPGVRALFLNTTKHALCTGKIRHVKSGYKPQFEALKALVQPGEVKNIKVTMAPPEWHHVHLGNRAFKPGVYPDRDAYFHDIAVAYRQELEVLYAAGCRSVQINDPIIAYICAHSMRQGLRDEGEDPDALLGAYVRLYNNCLATRRQDMTVGLHLCLENSVHLSEGGYEVIAAKLFNEVDVDCYYLECDARRADVFESLKHLPKYKSVVLGLVTTKFPELEDMGVLRERVFEAARVMAASGAGETVEEALQRVCVSPQCGFASHEQGNSLGADDMKKKLRLVRELATSIWADA